MRRAVIEAVLLVALAGGAFSRWGVADEGFVPGHSHYGEAFDRGPRHSAYLIGGTGRIHFPGT
jgi:hypothetical protein